MVGCRIAACQRRRAQMRHPFEALHNTPDEELAAPDRSVVSEARSIKADAHNAVLPGRPFGEDRCDVRPMVLDGVWLRTAHFGGIFGAEILRMSIASDDQFFT